MGVYEELGVRSFINCRGALTRFGGAIMAEEVLRAMAEAGRRGVALSDLQERAGRAIAALTGNEAAYISCGAASGITLAVAACMAGLDEAAAARLPDTAGMPGRVLMAASDCGTECDTAIRASGARIAAVGTAGGASVRQWQAALAGEGVAAAVLLLAEERPGATFRDVVGLARAAGVPVLVDAAAAVPPRANLWRWTARPDGVDAIIVSGGKGIGGPQSSGLVLGRQAIVDGCAFHGVPNVRIGRGMKVGKEEMAGLYVAVKRLMAGDDAADQAQHAGQAEAIARALADLPGVEVDRPRPTLVRIRFSEAAAGMTYAAAYEWFLNSDPSILMAGARDGISLSTGMLAPGQEDLVAAQLRRCLGQC